MPILMHEGGHGHRHNDSKQREQSRPRCLRSILCHGLPIGGSGQSVIANTDAADVRLDAGFSEALDEFRGYVVGGFDPLSQGSKNEIER